MGVSAKVTRVVVGIILILIQCYSIFHAATFIKGGKIILVILPSLLIVGIGIWLIVNRNKPSRKSLKKPRAIYYVLIVGVMWVLFTWYQQNQKADNLQKIERRLIIE